MALSETSDEVLWETHGEMETIPISDDESHDVSCHCTFKQGWILGTLISFIGGGVVGLSARSAMESKIYAALFVIESLVCAIVSFCLHDKRKTQILRHYTVYFFICALSTPLFTWIGFFLD